MGTIVETPTHGHRPSGADRSAQIDLARTSAQILHRGEHLCLDMSAAVFGNRPPIEIDEVETIEHPALRSIHLGTNDLDVEAEKATTDRQK